ncbi:protein archease [Halobacteriales archaeon QS_4_69_34]|nr:MAG: protein archease [Halobacteriales archaeon QS_4_69_34]
MSFALREHTADVAVAATGTSLGETFAAVAEGLAAAMCEAIPESDPADDRVDGDRKDGLGASRFDLAVRAEGREALLYDYLDELIYQRDVRGVLPVDNRATVRCEEGRVGGEATGDGGDEQWAIEASARGVPLDAIDAREVKAVTYSEMAIEERDGGWRAYVVFDV